MKNGTYKGLATDLHWRKSRVVCNSTKKSDKVELSCEIQKSALIFVKNATENIRIVIFLLKCNVKNQA